ATEKVLDDGDMIVLVTDGFYEWENPDGEEFGMQRVEGVIRECRDCSAEDVISNLRQAVTVFCKGTKQKDDLTAVVLKRKVDVPAISTSESERAILKSPNGADVAWSFQTSDWRWKGNSLL